MNRSLIKYIHTYMYYSETFLHAKHVHNVNISFRLQLILIPLITINSLDHSIVICLNIFYDVCHTTCNENSTTEPL